MLKKYLIMVAVVIVSYHFLDILIFLGYYGHGSDPLLDFLEQFSIYLGIFTVFLFIWDCWVSEAVQKNKLKHLVEQLELYGKLFEAGAITEEDLIENQSNLQSKITAIKQK